MTETVSKVLRLTGKSRTVPLLRQVNVKLFANYGYKLNKLFLTSIAKHSRISLSIAFEVNLELDLASGRMKRENMSLRTSSGITTILYNRGELLYLLV